MSDHGDPLAVRRNPGADAARLARVPTSVGTVIKAWLKASPSDREALRATWPTLADALDALTWRPAPEGVGAGTPEAPVAPQNRSERAASAPGDMHEPRPYPASRLHFE